jgi:hypothetical protein
MEAMTGVLINISKPVKINKLFYTVNNSHFRGREIACEGFHKPPNLFMNPTFRATTNRYLSDK